MKRIAAALLLVAAPAGDAPDPVARFDRPPVVTVSLKDAPVEKALAEIARQAGCRAIPAPRAKGKVTLEAKDLPFWAAVDAVAGKAGLVLQGSGFADPPGKSPSFGTSDPLKLVAPPKDLLAAAPCTAGPVRVGLVAIVAERSGKAVARFAPEAEAPEEGGTTLRVGLKFAALDGLDRAEPGRLRVDRAVDEKGRALSVAGNPGTGMGMGDRGISGLRWIQFEARGGYGERLAELSGALEVRIPRGEATREMDLATLPATAKIGGTTLTVTAVGDGAMTLRLEGPLFPPEEGGDASPPDAKIIGDEKAGRSSHFPPEADDVRLHLFDAAGKPVECSGWGGGGGGGTMTLEYQLGGRPVRITVRAVEAIERREVPFRFADLPLPR